MTDLEARLAAALEAEARGAPDAAGLAELARDRADTRRRRVRVGLVGAAAVLAATPIVLKLATGADPDALNRGTMAFPTPSAAAPSTWRTESFRDLEVKVPPSWGHGTLSTWCLRGRNEPGAPVVERPNGGVRSIRCAQPEEGYGIQFFSTATFDPVAGDLTKPWRYGWEPGQVKVYPRDSWLAIACATCEYAVRVVAPDRRTAERVVDSVRTVDGVDSHGCSVRRTESAPRVATGTVAVCRYDGEGWLEQGELLTGGDADAAVAAVDAAPTAQMAYGPGPCKDPDNLPGEVLLREPGREVSVVFDSDCVHDLGVRYGDELYEVTDDVLYWALSPGFSGGIAGDVPVPERLRQR